MRERSFCKSPDTEEPLEEPLRANSDLTDQEYNESANREIGGKGGRIEDDGSATGPTTSSKGKGGYDGKRPTPGMMSSQGAPYRPHESRASKTP